MEMLPLFTLFPSRAHLHFSIGPYGERLSSEGGCPSKVWIPSPPAAAGSVMTPPPGQRVRPSPQPRVDWLWGWMTRACSLRSARASSPWLLDPLPPCLGDNLELSFLADAGSAAWAVRLRSISGRGLCRVTSPSSASDTDQPDPDEDKSALLHLCGAGRRRRVARKMFGPLGYMVQGKVVAESPNRRRLGRNHPTRGLRRRPRTDLLRPQSAWGERLGWCHQWEPRDEGRTAWTARC